jgi:hypothetical protein
VAAAFLVTGSEIFAEQLYQECLMDGVGEPLHVPDVVDNRTPTLGAPVITGED